MNISKSIRQLSVLFIVLFLGLSGGLVYWQVIAAKAVTTNAHNGRRCLLTNAPKRGRILDRNGVVLADNITLPGACGYVRRYTEPSLAGLLGYYAGPNYPSTGIEKQFDDYLSGKVGTQALDNLVNQTLHRAPDGYDLYLTIDVHIQQMANKDFDTPYEIDNENSFQTNRGAAIISDPSNGEILAMISRPSYDPNQLVQQLARGSTDYFDQLTKDPAQPLLMRPLQARYVPGSTYKTLTLASALDSGAVRLTDPWDQQHALGPVFFPGSGHPLGPDGNNLGFQRYTFHFPVTTEYGFINSDNVIFGQIGVKMGAQTWLDYNHRVYVDQQIPFDLPVAKSTVVNEGADLNVDLLAANSFGQGTDFVTPMQMSLIDNMVANNGQIMQPTVIKKIVDHNGNIALVENPHALGDRQVSAQAAQLTRQAMYGVVRCGSGSLKRAVVWSSPYNIIAKTGTAQIGGDKAAHSWMITQAPYDVTNPGQVPKLTIVGMKENGGEGAYAVGPMVTNMYDDILPYLKVQQPTPSDPNYCWRTKLWQTP